MNDPVIMLVLCAARHRARCFNLEVSIIINPESAEFFFCNPWRPKCLSQLFPVHLNTYVMGLRPLEIVLLSQCGDRL